MKNPGSLGEESYARRTIRVVGVHLRLREAPQLLLQL